MNRVQLKDLVLQQACEQSAVRYEDLGLPQELTVWVDPGEVSCRSGGGSWLRVLTWEAAHEDQCKNLQCAPLS